jgi:pimeloyl-ACP methyl ester carboxylesterase
VLPDVLAQVGAPEPVLVAHSDGASIALIHAGRHPVTGSALLAPHVVVEERTVAAIRRTRDSYDDGRAARADGAPPRRPDAPSGLVRRVARPAFRDWTLEPTPSDVTAPTLLIQGADDPYGTLEQLDRDRGARARAGAPLVLPAATAPHLEHETPSSGPSRRSPRLCPSTSRSLPRARHSRRRKRCTLPVSVRGSSSTNSTTCGYS